MLEDCIQNLMAQMHIPGMSIALVQAGEPVPISTIPDLVKWEQALQQGTLISQSGLEAMWQPQLSTHGNEWEHLRYGVGLGWFVLNYQGRRVVGHHGSILGFASNITKFIDDNITARSCCAI